MEDAGEGEGEGKSFCKTLILTFSQREKGQDLGE
jgi:hypothetical protein